jgi:hypothetical protein
MIVQTLESELLLTRQVDHAEASGVLAGRWGNDAFPRPVYFDSVVLACARHDDAWRLLDETPSLDPETSTPYTFLTTPLDVILPAYYDAADTVGDRDPYAGFLVSMHYQGFFNSRFGLDASLPMRSSRSEEGAKLSAYFSAMEQLRGRLRSTAVDRGVRFGHVLSAKVAHAYLLLQVVDAISLFLCMNPKGEWPLGEAFRTIGGEKTALSMKPAGEGAVQVQPWPFDAPQIEIQFPVRRIPQPPYPSEKALREAFEAAPVERRTYRIRRGST